MKVWRFKKYEKTEFKDNDNILKTWFYQCENRQHYKELFAFLYNLDSEELFDEEIENLLIDIKEHGIHAFIEQYKRFGHIGFSSRIVLVS